MKKKTRTWLEIAIYDMETAQAMFSAKRYLYVAFMCHQSIEKLLKAIIAETKQEHPPFTHNLVLLSSLIGTKLSKEQLDLLAMLNPYNLEARYPKTKIALHKLCTRKTALKLLKQTEKLFLWLKQNAI